MSRISPALRHRHLALRPTGLSTSFRVNSKEEKEWKISKEKLVSPNDSYRWNLSLGLSSFVESYFVLCFFAAPVDGSRETKEMAEREKERKRERHCHSAITFTFVLATQGVRRISSSNRPRFTDKEGKKISFFLFRVALPLAKRSYVETEFSGECRTQ